MTIEIIKLILNLALFGIASIGIFIMGLRTVINPLRLDVFNDAGLSSTVILVWSYYCMAQALLILHPRTLVIGCILLLLNNIFVTYIYLKVGYTKEAVFEAAAMSIAIGLIWLGHPYTNWTQMHVNS